MSQTVEIPNQGIAEFPDSMTPDEIKGVIQKKFYAQAGEVTPPSVPESPSAVATEAGKAAPDLGQVAKTAGEALGETVAGFIPRSAAQVGELATPLVSGIEEAYKGIASLSDVLFGGKSPTEAATQEFPESRALVEAEKTPPFSKERFQAGFGTVAQLGMAAGLAKGLQPKPTLTETLGFGEKTPDVVTATNDALSGLESSFGKQEPVAPNLPTGTGEVINETTKTEPNTVPIVPTRETVYQPDISAPKEGEYITAPDPSGLYDEVAVGWRQSHEELVKRALSKWKGSPTDIRFHMREEASGNPQPESGGAKQTRAQSAALLYELKNNAKTTPKLYRGDGVDPKTGEPYPWSESKEIAKEFAGKNGKVHELPAGQKGLRIQDYSDKPSVFDTEQEWIVRTQKPSPVQEAPVSTTAPLSTQTEGEINAIEPSNAQVETGETAQRVQAGTESEIPRPSSSDNALREAQGAAESGQIPARQGTEAGTQTAQDEITPTTEAGGTGEAQISTKNAYTEAQRAIRGLPEAEQAAKRGFGKVWDEAASEAEKDPTIGRRLVSEINSNPRPISDVENAHLLRREIEAQKEHSDAVDAVNSATTDSDLTAAKARLESARNDLQDVYDATKSAGTKGGQALAARQMLAKEDYSLAKMEARRRAANDGKPLNETQLAETSELHAKIADLQSKLDAHEVASTFDREFKKLVDESRKEAKSSKTAGTRFTDFMDRKANEARARITERRGQLTTGFDPTAITDEAIIGASHIAKGVTKFADWSVEMAKEFGDQIRPFLKELWERSKAFHDANASEYGDKALARYKTYLGKQTEQIKSKLEAGDFTKAQRQKTQLDKEAFEMRANLQKLKNQFERGVAKEAYKNKTPAQKFWDHFVGVERAMKLSGPEVFGKLGMAAAVREVLAPIEAAGGYGVSKVFPKLAKGTEFGADLGTVVRSEIKAKAALFTSGMKDAWQNVKGQETGLDAIGKQKIRPDFWYNRIGQMHAAIKAPVKRAEFTRSLEKRMAVAIKNGEDINHPEVMTRLANESVMEANRAIFQNKTVVSGFFSMLDRQSPVAGRAARFLFPVVKIPVNLFKELVNLHVGAPVGAARVGMAYWKGVETLPVAQREAIIRQLTKGSIGGAGLLWGYYNSDKVRNFFDHVPTWFNHTPMAMILNEGSYLKKLEQGGEQSKEGKKELAYMAKTDIPFMYTIKDIGDALDTHNSHALLNWINNMTQSTVVPQILTQTAKQMDKPGSFPSNIGERPKFRPASNPIEAVKAGIPGLRQSVPEAKPKNGASRLRGR